MEGPPGRAKTEIWICITSAAPLAMMQCHAMSSQLTRLCKTGIASDNLHRFRFFKRETSNGQWQSIRVPNYSNNQRQCIVSLTNQFSNSLNSLSNIWAYTLVTCVYIIERKRVNFVPFIFERLKTSEIYFLLSLYLSSLSSLTLVPLQLSAVSNPDPASSARLSFYFDSVCLLRSRFAAASGKSFSI